MIVLLMTKEKRTDKLLVTTSQCALVNCDIKHNRSKFNYITFPLLCQSAEYIFFVSYCIRRRR